MPYQPPLLKITAPDGRSNSTHIELDGVDMTTKLHGIELRCLPGQFWRARLELIVSVDAETRALIAAHDGERQRVDAQDDRATRIHAAAQVLFHETLDLPPDLAEALYTIQKLAIAPPQPVEA